MKGSSLLFKLKKTRQIYMLFGGHKKKSGGIGGILRTFLSIFMMAILGLGVFQAYKTFSGYDPLSVSPKSVASNFLNSKSLFEFINGILTLSPSKSLDGAKKILGGNPQKTIPESQLNASKTVKFRFGVISDTHNDNPYLAKALQNIKAQGGKFVIGLGDYTDVGTPDELTRVKQEFDNAGLTYYLTIGDHDLWDSRNKKQEPSQNFTDVFNTIPYQSFSFEEARFILIYNSDNYLGLDAFQINWIEEELKREELKKANPVFVFAAIPLYHPSSDHVMGKTTPKLKNQAEHLNSIFKRHGVAEVFAGDTHFYSRYKEPKNDLPMTNVGAVTSIRNPQAPRFVMVDVFDDGGYNVLDVEIK